MAKRSNPKRDFMEVARNIVEHAIGSSLRVIPAMESGTSNHVWSIEELCSLLPENRKIAVDIDKALILKALAEKAAV
jgi:hypothetical protein